MDTPYSPKSIYEREVQQLKMDLAVLSNRSRTLGWLRLLLFVATAAGAYFVFKADGYRGWLVIAAGVALFLYLLSQDADNRQRLRKSTNLLQINEDELLVLDNAFQHRYDGAHFAPPLHNYAADLDVFGPFSLFQYINRCHTEGGKGLLADNLLHPLPAAETESRHAAVKELAPQYKWLQQLQALSVQTPVTNATQTRLQHWLEGSEEVFGAKAWAMVLLLYAVITIGSAVAAFLDYIPAAAFSALFLLYFFLSTFLSRKPAQAHFRLSRITGEVSTLYQLINLIEATPFQASLLTGLQSSLRVTGSKAAGEIKSLKDILNRFDLRLNVFVFFFLNSFLLWDVWQMRALNNWRRRNRLAVPHWFNALSEVEVLGSLAVLHFNKPHWCLPRVDARYFTFAATGLGHPLIPEVQRVNNDFTLSGAGRLALITGSNMAGKSTFLRSLGANTVLAQMGAPVCAASFTLSPVHLMSSMRIADNLAENTSTFYAELKKLRAIIEAVNRHEPLFILLDEILRGTNSLDRHAGSKALMRQLIKEGAVAVLATHDVALATEEEPYAAAVENYHFDVVFKGDELLFDYKLKGGVCTSLNASVLMKKIGIEL